MIDSNFKTAIDILNRNKIPYWVCHGSLLGLIRDGNLIKWDHDIDIAVMKSQVNKESLKDLFVQAGFIDRKGNFENTIHFRKNGGKFLDINFYHKLFDKPENNEYGVFYKISKDFPIFRIINKACDNHEHDGRYYFLVKILRFFRPIFLLIKTMIDAIYPTYINVGYSIPFDLIQDFKYIYIHGLKIRIPKKSIETCELIYGKNWKKPLKEYNWITDSQTTKKI